MRIASQDIDALLSQATAALDNEDHEPARTYTQQALAEARAAGLKPQLVRAHELAATLAYRDTDHAPALRHVIAANVLAQETGDALLSARVASVAALVSWSTGDCEGALRELESALPAALEGDDPDLLFHTTNRLGAVYSALDDPQTGLHWHQRALQISLQFPTRRQEALALGNIGARELEIAEQHHSAGLVEAAREAFETSIQHSRQAMAIAEDSAMPRLQQMYMPNLGAALARLGRTDEALDVLLSHRALAQAVGETLSPLYTAASIARIHMGRGDLAAARQAAQAGITQGTGRGSLNALDGLYEIASQIEEQAGNFALALAHYKQFHEVRTQQALDRANLRAKVMAVRLETETARAEAQHERLRARSLLRSNEELTERAHSLSRAALLDPLTGLGNRRHLDAELARLHAAALAGEQPLCAALLDIDQFKLVNDRYSHAVGDAVLRRVGAILQAHCRGGDLAARYGGEEFLIAFPGVEMARAHAACERLRMTIEHEDWGAIATGLRVTASLGLHDLAANPLLADGMAEADRRLYAAKSAGRNRVVGG